LTETSRQQISSNFLVESGKGKGQSWMGTENPVKLGEEGPLCLSVEVGKGWAA
jgi:hypothetical protein